MKTHFSIVNISLHTAKAYVQTRLSNYIITTNKNMIVNWQIITMVSADLYSLFTTPVVINKVQTHFQQSQIVSKRQGGDEKTVFSLLIIDFAQMHKTTVHDEHTGETLNYCVCLCERYFMYCRSELPVCLRIIIASATS